MVTVSRSITSPSAGTPNDTPDTTIFMGIMPFSRRGIMSPFLVGSKRLIFFSTGTSRTPESQTPGSRTVVHVLMGEKEKNVWSVVILLKQRNSSSVL
ncbi:hypothetical protein TNCV_1151011 [Trichonephila clavipes]|nr:hypothetical protein TNCV_1151011 [Trichonephila clavipes]